MFVRWRGSAPTAWVDETNTAPVFLVAVGRITPYDCAEVESRDYLGPFCLLCLSCETVGTDGRTALIQDQHQRRQSEKRQARAYEGDVVK